MENVKSPKLHSDREKNYRQVLIGRTVALLGLLALAIWIYL